MKSMRFRLFCCSLGFSCLLAACTSAPAGDVETNSSLTGEDVVTTDAVTAAPVQMLPLVEGGNSDYVIIRAEEAEQREIEAASLLAQYLKNHGVEVKFSTDFKRMPVYAHEIIVGKTERESADTYTVDRELLGESGFSVAMAGDKLYLAGGTADATYAAAEWLIEELLEPALGADGKLTTFALPADYIYTAAEARQLSSVTLGGRKVDEFVIAAASPAGEAAAQSFSERLVELAGVRLPVVSTADAAGKPVILFSDEPRAGKTLAALEEGNLVFRFDERLGASRAADDFIAAELETAKGEYRMAESFRMETPYANVVYYEDYGAVGDGVTDDLAAICAAHEAANAKGLSVAARAGAKYYIGGGAQTAQIRTDTDWRGAEFIIDDRAVENRGAHVFCIAPDTQPLTLSITGPLKVGQDKLDVTLPGDCMVVLADTGTLRYIRKGANQNNGSAQTEACLVHADGSIDPSTPLIWDYAAVTSAIAYPIDEKTLTLRGGKITTIANAAPSAYTYYNRGIAVNRSNTVVEDLVHLVTEEGATGAPYTGFIAAARCANVTVKNCVFTGHKTYKTIGSAGTSVSMGTYEINGNLTVNLSFIGCTQTNDIHDSTYWGVLGSNYCKNMLYEDCVFSRFDAHMGVANATIRRCTLGHQGLNAIGFGTLTVEDSTICGSSFINLRNDYGSTWQGDVVIRDCVFIPKGGKSFSSAAIFGGSNDGTHDFGYTCYLPATVTIDGFTVRDGGASSGYDGLTVFANINSKYTSAGYTAAYPIVLPEAVSVSGFSSVKGKPLTISPNTVMFGSVRLAVTDAAAE